MNVERTLLLSDCQILHITIHLALMKIKENNLYKFRPTQTIIYFTYDTP